MPTRAEKLAGDRLRTENIAAALRLQLDDEGHSIISIRNHQVHLQ